MYYGKSKRCERCGGYCTDSDLKFQNPKAMYQSERRATYWHQACFNDASAQDRAYLAEIIAESARGLEMTRAALEVIRAKKGN